MGNTISRKATDGDYTLLEIADFFRRNYPNAVLIEFSVNLYGYTLTLSYKDNPDGASTRTLGGEWINGIY